MRRWKMGIMDDRDIGLMDKGDLEDVLSISAYQLGPSYLSESDLKTMMNDKNTRIPLLILRDKVIGYSIIHLVDKAKMDNYSNEPIAQHFHHLKEIDIVQLRKTTAIHPEYVGKGFGRKFIEETMTMYAKHCRLILSINWQRKDHIPMKKISESLGMNQGPEIPNYWTEESRQKNYVCPECGQPPCTCSAVLFTKEVN